MNVLTNFGMKFFQNSEDKFSPITPIQDFIDIELGGNIHLPTSTYSNLEMKQDKLDNPDLELGFGPIVEMTNNHIIIRMQTNNNNAIIENYYSLFDSINYINMSYRNEKKYVK